MRKRPGDTFGLVLGPIVVGLGGLALFVLLYLLSEIVTWVY